MKDAVAEAFPDEAGDVAGRRLVACGLGGVAERRIATLSRSARSLVRVATTLTSGAVLDELCTGLDQGAAAAVAAAVGALVRERKWTGVVVATCVDAVAEALRPDWAFRSTTGELKLRRPADDNKADDKAANCDAAAVAHVASRAEAAWAAAVARAFAADFRPPQVTVTVEACENDVWERFKAHHYLSRKLSGAARCFVALDACGRAVAFDSRVSKRGNFAFAQSRFVVLPDYQGLGLANALANAVARLHFRVGLVYYSRTSHWRLGAARNRSPQWRACDSNGAAVDQTCCLRKRVGFSHFYVGDRRAGDLDAFRSHADAKDLALVLRRMKPADGYADRGAKCARCDARRPGKGANHARCAGACGLSYCDGCLAARGDARPEQHRSWKCADCEARGKDKRPSKKKPKRDAAPSGTILSFLKKLDPPPRPPAPAPKEATPPAEPRPVIVIDHSEDDDDDDAGRRTVATPVAAPSQPAPPPVTRSLNKRPRDSDLFSDDDDDDDDVSSDSSEDASSDDDDDDDGDDALDEDWMDTARRAAPKSLRKMLGGS